jgi:hypothetical protein
MSSPNEKKNLGTWDQITYFDDSNVTIENYQDGKKVDPPRVKVLDLDEPCETFDISKLKNMTGEDTIRRVDFDTNPKC